MDVLWANTPLQPELASEAYQGNMMAQEAALRNIFQSHQLNQTEQEQLAAIRQACFDCAKVIVQNSPQGPDQTVAIRHLSDAMMVANAGVCRKGQFYPPR